MADSSARRTDALFYHATIYLLPFLEQIGRVRSQGPLLVAHSTQRSVPAVRLKVGWNDVVIDNKVEGRPLTIGKARIRRPEALIADVFMNVNGNVFVLFFVNGP